MLPASVLRCVAGAPISMSATTAVIVINGLKALLIISWQCFGKRLAIGPPQLKFSLRSGALFRFAIVKARFLPFTVLRFVWLEAAIKLFLAALMNVLTSQRSQLTLGVTAWGGESCMKRLLGRNVVDRHYLYAVAR